MTIYTDQEIIERFHAVDQLKQALSGWIHPEEPVDYVEELHKIEGAYAHLWLVDDKADMAHGEESTVPEWVKQWMVRGMQ